MRFNGVASLLEFIRIMGELGYNSPLSYNQLMEKIKQRKYFIQQYGVVLRTDGNLLAIMFMRYGECEFIIQLERN